MKKVLIVEDVEFNLDLLVHLLEDEYELLTARDGAEGVELAVTEEPDLILMVMSLPLMDGWQVTRRVREERPIADTPIIGLSAHAMSGDRQKALDAGCNEYLTKPLDDEVLLSTIRKLLGEQTS